MVVAVSFGVTPETVVPRPVRRFLLAIRVTGSGLNPRAVGFGVVPVPLYHKDTTQSRRKRTPCLPPKKDALNLRKSIHPALRVSTLRLTLSGRKEGPLTLVKPFVAEIDGRVSPVAAGVLGTPCRLVKRGR